MLSALSGDESFVVGVPKVVVLARELRDEVLSGVPYVVVLVGEPWGGGELHGEAWGDVGYGEGMGRVVPSLASSSLYLSAVALLPHLPSNSFRCVGYAPLLWCVLNVSPGPVSRVQHFSKSRG